MPAPNRSVAPQPAPAAPPASPGEPAWADRAHGAARLLLVPTFLACTAVAALAIDAPLARLSHDHGAIDWLGGIVRCAEMFGHGTSVAFIALTIWLLDPARRPALPRVLIMSWGAGLAANLVKLLFVARARPYLWLTWGTDRIADSFGPWLPLARYPSNEQGFPSAHSATAVGLALALAWLYPRGRWLFATFAVLVGLQRITGDAHFLSDVLAGAALGWLVALESFRGQVVPRLLGRLDAALARAHPAPHAANPPTVPLAPRQSPSRPRPARRPPDKRRRAA